MRLGGVSGYGSKHQQRDSPLLGSGSSFAFEEVGRGLWLQTLKIEQGRLPVVVCFHNGNQQKVMKGGGSPMLLNDGTCGLAPTLCLGSEEDAYECCWFGGRYKHIYTGSRIRTVLLSVSVQVKNKPHVKCGDWYHRQYRAIEYAKDLRVMCVFNWCVLNMTRVDEGRKC